MVGLPSERHRIGDNSSHVDEGLVKPSGSVSAYMQSSSVFAGEAGSNRLEVASWERTISIAVNEMRWKILVMKQFIEVLPRRILALETVCGSNIDLAWDVISAAV